MSNDTSIPLVIQGLGASSRPQLVLLLPVISSTLLHSLLAHKVLSFFLCHASSRAAAAQLA
jgi:hypothetical protein